jgi:hypothetical protein
MSGRIGIVALIALSAINFVVLAVNLSAPVRADVAEMDRRALYQDREFRWAVEDVISTCKIDGQKITC